jgi:hypothetical protein
MTMDARPRHHAIIYIGEMRHLQPISLRHRQIVGRGGAETEPAMNARSYLGEYLPIWLPFDRFRPSKRPTVAGDSWKATKSPLGLPSRSILTGNCCVSRGAHGWPGWPRLMIVGVAALIPQSAAAIVGKVAIRGYISA